MKVLIVEDELPLLKAIVAKMKCSGVEAECAISAEEAKAKISHFKPDLIWLDHYLYGAEDGLDLLKNLKNQRSTKDIPVFVVSNTCTNEKYRDYIELGIQKFFVKSSTKLQEIIDDAKSLITK